MRQTIEFDGEFFEWLVKAVRPSAANLYILLKGCANGATGRIFYLDIQALTGRLGIRERTLRVLLKELLEVGVLVKEPHMGVYAGYWLKDS